MCYQSNHLTVLDLADFFFKCVHTDSKVSTFLKRSACLRWCRTKARYLACVHVCACVMRQVTPKTQEGGNDYATRSTDVSGANGSRVQTEHVTPNADPKYVTPKKPSASSRSLPIGSILNNSPSIGVRKCACAHVRVNAIVNVGDNEVLERNRYAGGRCSRRWSCVLIRGVIVHQVRHIHPATADRLRQSEARAGPLPHLRRCFFSYS
jgi:hypothetical protein